MQVLDSDIQEIYERLIVHRHLIDGKNFLIIGDGFLGNYFKRTLLKFENVEITVLDKNTNVYQENPPEVEGYEKIKYIRQDLLSNETLNDISGKFDYVLAGASIASPKVYKQYPVETLDVGYIGLKKCLDRAIDDGAKLLFFSSSEVYGTADIIPTPETYVGAIPSDNERSCYDLSKIVGSALVHYYVQKKKLNASIVLPFNFYGPQKPDGRVMPSFMYNIVNNRPLEVFNGGKQERCYTYITDGIVGCLKVLLFGGNGEKYNIGNPNEEVSVLELASKMKKVINKEIVINIIDYPETYAGTGDPIRRVPDINKAFMTLNFEPEVNLDEGIKRFYEWAKVNYKEGLR